MNIEREFPHEKAFCTDFVPGAVRRKALKAAKRQIGIGY